MLKTLAVLLLATAATAPALAQDHPDWHQGGQHREGGWQRGQADQHRDGGWQGGQVDQHRDGGWQGGQVDQHREGGNWQRGDHGEHRFQGGFAGMAPDHVDRPGQPGWERRDADPRGYERRDAPRGQWYGHPGERQDWERGRGEQHGGWDRGWRDDRRYDWRDWRDSHRELFRVPAYRAPYGYGYRRFWVGAELPPLFFGPDYWIADPFYYHLPPAYGPYHWVRYFNDALLVDVRTGQVVDMIPGLFW